MANVTVTFTDAQVKALHETLSMVTNDPDWADFLGSQREFATLARAHDRLMEARRKAHD